MKTFCLLLAFLAGSTASISNPGPRISPSVGEVWPKPQNQTDFDFQLMVIDPSQFYFEITGKTCHILEDALMRYRNIISNVNKSDLKIESTKFIQPNRLPPTMVKFISINLKLPCEDMPHFGMDESYDLSIGNARIDAKSIWGMLRGLETFSQLLTPYAKGMLRLPGKVEINDFPRFSHRGLLVDTARHFLHMSTLYKILDGMSYNKLNVFHWHIVDDESFPYVSRVHPELARKGSYVPGMRYTQQDVADLIEYARLRGIRVIAEFDVPSHTRSWGNAHPELLAQCGTPYEGMLGPMNPIKNETFKFLSEFLSEVLDVFPDRFMHLGGDEVGFECWQTNPEIVEYVAKNHVTYDALQKVFSQRVASMVTAQSRTPIFWQEAMIDNVDIEKSSVAQVWLGDWQDLVKKFTSNGHRIILSACWYLDHLTSGGDWQSFYSCEPQDFDGTDEQNNLMMGGEACMWSEVVSDSNVLQRIFPRVSAVAERLWSSRTVINADAAAPRLEEHTCRMVNRGIPAQPPNGAGFC